MKNIYIILLSLCGLLFLIGIIMVAVIPRSQRSQRSPDATSAISAPVNISTIIKSGNIFTPVGTQYKIETSKGYINGEDSLISINNVEGTSYSITKSDNGFTIQSLKNSKYIGFSDIVEDDVPHLGLLNDQIYWNIVNYKDNVLLSSTLKGQTYWLKLDSYSDSVNYLNGVKADTPFDNSFLFVMEPL